MRHISWIVTLPIVLVAAVFAVVNREPIKIDLWPLPWDLYPPLYLVVLGCLFVGFLVGGMAAWFSGARRRRLAREAGHRAGALAREVAELRRQARRPSSEAGAAGPPAMLTSSTHSGAAEA
jgi:uncharacterized integral membrane protein